MSSCASPSRRYHLLPPAGPGPIINCKGGSSHTGSTAMMVSAHETTLLRWLGLCTAALLLLDIWAWVAPGVLATSGTEHTVAEFDSASLLYLVPLTLHALAALSFFTHKRQSTLALWAPAVRLRVVSLACLALAVPTLLARVVTLQQYCRLEGRVAEKEGQEEEGSSLFKACSSGHVGLNAAMMAIAYTLLGLLLLQTLTHLEALCQWQQQHQHGLHAHHQRARRRLSSSHDDGHTPPSGCGFDEEAYYDYSSNGTSYYVPPPLPFPFHQQPRGQRQQQQEQQQQAWSLASVGTGSSSLDSSMPSPERYLHQHRAGPIPSSSSSGAAAVVYPGVSSAAAATAQTLYGDVSQYDDPAPRVLVHRSPFSSGSGTAMADDDGAEEEEEESGAATEGSGAPLTLSSGGPGSSAFSNYVVPRAPTKTTS